ncbi:MULTISPECIES: LytR/AlgR family response regulator transcription factor [unclassified Alistipes]|uniref:LytR/AlgR family response regulator transcription factor n=1 Tax=unclassified Alistipes TaxID=2608932 RepID=UPI0007A9345F|nr:MULTISPECIES: LytTR family DNA-binding domain-containing protein [unclassified Alistipes]CVI69398.1 Sensory transduction protein LytR [Alistipes sp. CHKCI003]HJC77340.1 LytTR family DNA-binding domain-containing protein [Candidatus Alistipes excrementavium]
MLKCLAIDDEPLALRQLTAYIGKIPYLELAGSCNNALEAQQFLTTHPVELIFVDINMPDLNGVDFVRSLVQRPMVIFTTAYSEYAVEGFKLDAVDYLLKPFSFADFSRSAAKANSLYELRQNQHRPASDEAEPPAEAAAKDKEYLSVKADYKVSLVKISDIVYLESEGEYVRMHLADHTAITTLFRLKNMETALPADTFMRVHRSYIVNLKCIKSYIKGRIYLSDTEYVPIGENYRETFQRYIDRMFKNLQ